MTEYCSGISVQHWICRCEHVGKGQQERYTLKEVPVTFLLLKVKGRQISLKAG